MKARTGEDNVPNEQERFTLADVLLAILKSNDSNSWAISDEGEFFFFTTMPFTVKFTGVYWNLEKDSLEHQEPPTIDFIFNLLK